MKITINGAEYDVPAEVASYIQGKQSAERVSVMALHAAVTRTQAVGVAKYMNMPVKEQLAFVMTLLVEHQENVKALLGMATELAIRAKLLQDAEECDGN